MKKLLSVRAHLLASALAIKADKLLTFAEAGSLVFHRGAGAGSFAVTYTAHVIVTDFAGEAQQLFWVVLQWMDRHCPDMGPEALRFHVDIIDHKTADVSLKLDLVEVVRARDDDNGTWLAAQDDADALRFDMADLAPGLE